MKLPFFAFLWLALGGCVLATDKVVTQLVTIPIYHKGEDAEVRFVAIPHVGWDLNAFWHCENYSAPFKAGHSNLQQDINLISLYGLKVNYTCKNGVSRIDVVTAGALKPEGFKFSVKDVVDLTVQAIQRDFPDREQTEVYIDGVKRNHGEVVDPPSDTRSDSGLKGLDQLEPEAEGRSR